MNRTSRIYVAGGRTLLGAALLDRLRAGKIYPEARIPWALEHFFRDQNLATLRELSLREVAQNHDRTLSRQPSSAPAAPAPGRVMVCLSSNPPHGATLLRRGSRVAGRLNTDWYVVYVETSKEDPARIDAEAQRRLHANIDKARELGAEFVRLRSEEPASALLDFARTHRVSDLVVGRGREPWWRRALRLSVLDRIVDEAEGLDVHVVSFEGDGGHA